MIFYLSNTSTSDINEAYSVLNPLFYIPYRDITDFKKTIKDRYLAYHKNRLYLSREHHYFDYQEPKFLCQSLDEFIQKVNEERLLSIL